VGFLRRLFFGKLFLFFIETKVLSIFMKVFCVCVFGFDSNLASAIYISLVSRRLW
jgi:hypothetical protein